MRISHTALVALGLGALGSLPVHASPLTLTSAGIADGFGLAPVISGAPNSGAVGPLGTATNSLGQIVMQDYVTGQNYVYSDTNGQAFSSYLSAAPYQSTSYGAALTNSGGTLFATNNDAGQIVYKLNPDGSINSALTGMGVGGHGIWTNPLTGDLVAATSNGINDINPTTGTHTTIVPNANVDGVSVSANGQVYGAASGYVYGWNYSGQLVYTSPYLGSPDGTGVIQGSTSLAGDVIANSNDGTVWLLNPTKGTATEIASGGSRGDYVGVDKNDGSLFLSQTDSVYRLTCGANCGFTTPVPLPPTLTLLLSGLISAALVGRRRLIG